MDRVKAASLVIDYGLYPRQEINGMNTAALEEAYRMGRKVPPVKADRVTRRVADGAHRVKAAIRAFGAEAEVEVTWEDYADDWAFFRDAVALNSDHGRQLSPFDRARCLVISENLGRARAEIAEALGISLETLDRLYKHKVATAPGGGSMAIKATIEHLAGTQLTQNQVDGNRAALGMSPLYYINQVIALIEHDLIPPKQRVHDRLAYLGQLIALRYPVVSQEEELDIAN